MGLGGIAPVVYTDTMIKFTSTDTDNIFACARWGYWGYAKDFHFTYLDVDALADSWTMHLHNPEDVDGYTPKRIDATALAEAAASILDSEVKVGSYIYDMLAQDLRDWRENPQYGVPFDADLSEILVQVACFGEVVFG